MYHSPYRYRYVPLPTLIQQRTDAHTCAFRSRGDTGTAGRATHLILQLQTNTTSSTGQTTPPPPTPRKSRDGREHELRWSHVEDERR